MGKQCIAATGYLSIFIVPTLFLIGLAIDKSWLAFGVVIMVFPLARAVFGALPAAGAPEWQESIATALDHLPVIFAVTMPVFVLSGLALGADAVGVGAGTKIGIALSLWMTLLFGTCVAHELIHRRDGRQAVLGYALAGFCGYPALGMEHLAHHARPGDTRMAEYPLRSESLWQFAGRRLRRVHMDVFGPGAAVWNPQIRLPNLVRTRVALLAMALTLSAFWLLGGMAGALLYLLVCCAVAFGIQLITYIQHWGLGDDSIPDRTAYGRGWEEDCRFQAWVTLSISLHDQHHRDSRRPFYRLDLAPDSPRLPAGYVLLMFASMVPPVWRRLMEPRLARWILAPDRPQSAGRRITCFGLYDARDSAGT
jgi:alkane 1-monooxygenase